MADGKKDATQRSARIARFYYDGAIALESDLTLDKQASHHLSTVLRCKPGDEVVLFNGDGHDYSATLLKAGERRSDSSSARQAVLHIQQRHSGIPESPLHITLVQSVSRPERMDISLRQAVELGVSCIQPVYSRHSIKVNDEKRAQKKQQHWHSIVTSACEQSGRSVVPALNASVSFRDWLKQSNNASNKLFVLDPLATHSLTEAVREWHLITRLYNLTLIIGPESGLDEREISEAKQAGASAVTLGPRILRTETAGPACIALLQSLLGDL